MRGGARRARQRPPLCGITSPSPHLVNLNLIPWPTTSTTPLAGHGLPHDPFKAIVAPRLIGWISSRDTARHVEPRAL